MNSPIFFLVTIWIFLSFSVFSQNGKIQGIVLDSETRESIPFATVALLQQNETAPIRGVITDSDGNFEIDNIPDGQYQLSISFMGFKTHKISELSLSPSSASLHLGPIELTPTQLMVNEVQVTARARTETSHLDRRTYRTEDFETARGGNAADVLNRLPSIGVSPDGEVTVRGTADFVVYLNGRPTQMEPSMFLSQIAASSIESIDVITVPSARYDAQGKGGIINITTRTADISGFSLNAEGLVGGSPWGNRNDAISRYHLNDDRYGGGLNMAYVNNGLVVYGGLNYRWRDVHSIRSGDARILNPSDGSYKHMVASGMKPEWYENFSTNLGLELDISDQSKLTTAYYYGTRTEGRKALYLYHIFTADQDKNPISGIPVNEQWRFNPNEGIREGEFHTFNVDFSHQINQQSDLKLAFLYEHSTLTHSVDNPNIIYNPDSQTLQDKELHYRQKDETPLDGFRLSADYTNEFDNGHVLSLGIQPQIFKIDGGLDYDTLNVNNNIWGTYTELQNEIELNRDIYAAYADMSGKLSELEYKIGLRFEYTKQALQISNPDYFSLFERAAESEITYKKADLFPSLHLSNPLFERDNIQLAASRRISRAPLKNMAPFLFRRHLEVYLVGDPELKPEYINNFELSYSKGLGRQRLTLTGFHRAVNNAIFRVNTVYEEELVLIRSFTNSGNTKATGAELNANLNFGPKAQMFLGGSLYDYRVEADIFGYQEQNQSLSWDLKTNASIDLSDQWRLSADFNMLSAQVTAQGRNEIRYTSNAALAYSPGNLSGWNFTLRGLNLIDSNTRALSTRAHDSKGTQIFYQDTDYYWYGPIAELSISYNMNWKGPTKKGESVFGKDEF